MADNPNSSFGSLPVALVGEIIGESGKIAEDIYAPFRDIAQKRDAIREKMNTDGLILLNGSSGGDIVSSCGIGTAHSLKKFLASDFVCCAAFGAEGILPPSAKPVWTDPAHRAVFHTIADHPENGRLAAAVAMELTVELATGAPHNIVLLRGSFITPFAVFMDCLKHAIAAKDTMMGKEFLGRVKSSVMAFKKIFLSQFPGADAKIRAGIMNSSPKREMSSKLGLPPTFDETVLFTLLLSPGEYTAPVPADRSELQRIKAIPINDPAFSSVRDSIAVSAERLNVVYFRPHSWTRAMRIEIDSSVTGDPALLKRLLDTVSFQCGSPGVSEPYPLSAAENVVKSMTEALPTIREMVAARITCGHGDDLGNIFSLLMGVDSWT